MSSGSTVRASYIADDASVRPIRVQPETIAGAWNPDGTGTVNGSFVRVSGSKKGIGLKARYVTLARPLGAVVEGIQPVKRISLPVMTPDAFDALNLGQDVAYGGADWEITGKFGESGK